MPAVYRWIHRSDGTSRRVLTDYGRKWKASERQKRQSDIKKYGYFPAWAGTFANYKKTGAYMARHGRKKRLSRKRKTSSRKHSRH